MSRVLGGSLAGSCKITKTWLGPLPRAGLRGRGGEVSSIGKDQGIVLLGKSLRRQSMIGLQVQYAD